MRMPAAKSISSLHTLVATRSAVRSPDPGAPNLSADAGEVAVSGRTGVITIVRSGSTSMPVPTSWVIQKLDARPGSGAAPSIAATSCDQTEGNTDRSHHSTVGTSVGSRQMDLGVRGCEEATEIGRGAFGVVYRARQTLYNRTVAVKVLPVLDDKARGRFDREREAMGALSSHPNIVSVYDSGTTPDGRSYLVMDFMAGGTLAERLAQQGPIPWAEVTALGVKLAGALEAAHGAGVLHRDLKPENALISAYGEPALADFGIARVQGAARSTTGAITGTLAYIAPEILAGRPPSAQSDVYGLGSTLFALLAGGPAFIYDTDESIMPAKIGRASCRERV